MIMNTNDEMYQQQCDNRNNDNDNNNMASLTSLSTGSAPTQTGTWTSGPELPGCWMVTSRKQETRVRYVNLSLLVTTVDEPSANPGDTGSHWVQT